MRRKNALRMAKSQDMKVVQQKYEVDTKIASQVALEMWKQENMEDIKGAYMGHMLLTVLAFLRIKKGYAKKRITDFMTELNDFMTDMSYDKVKNEEIVEMLEDETGVNVKELFAMLDRKAKRDIKERRERTL